MLGLSQTAVHSIACSARALSHRTGEPRSRLQPGQKRRPSPQPAALRQDRLFGQLEDERLRLRELCARCFLRLADPPGGPASWKLRWVFKSAIRFLVSLSRLAMTLRVLSGLRGRPLEHRSENTEPASGPAPD